MQAVGIKTALACILFGFSSLGQGGHFQADEGVSLRRDAGDHFATEFPVLKVSDDGICFLFSVAEIRIWNDSSKEKRVHLIPPFSQR